MAAPSSPDAIRDVNTRYHDCAAADYDAKWGIDWGPIGREQVLGKLRKALGGAIPVFDRSLEIGAGTGYFSLHLLMAGVVGRATCTDISPGMVDALKANAERLQLEVDARVADAEALPFEDASFDTVTGTLVLCEADDPRRALDEISRVLRPGGRYLFLEHVRSGDPALARTQDRWAPIWKAFAGGCTCNRDTLATIEASGLDVQRSRMGRFPKSPKIVSPLRKPVSRVLPKGAKKPATVK